MKKSHKVLNLLTTQLDLPSDAVIGNPFLEMTGYQRVLIENHQGIREYSTNNIQVLVKCGCIEIRGDGLNIMSMTAEHLVITGELFGFELHRETHHA